jgi:hypothetical protein|tara:strand:- start:129 stop:743 length:615 start_codon:yes stop_codon:yes gene_type:complete
MAMESEDMTEITNSIVQILTDCILTENVKVETLSTFDIEYLFLNVRARSVGETVDINITCPDDEETQVEMTIDIDAIKIQKTRGHKNIIKLDDNLSMKLRYPSLQQFIENNFETGENISEVGQSLSMITSCIDMIYNDEESWESSDYSKKELDEFVEQMNTKQFKQIEKFFTTMPKLSHKLMVKNPNTGVESEVVLEGLAAFFS